MRKLICISPWVVCEYINEPNFSGDKGEKEYYADFICYDKIIVELKAVSIIVKAHKAQLINYLKAANKEIGLLINFGTNSLKWERISKFENK